MATARHHAGEQREGLDIGMLAVAALAAVAAAVVTSKLWPGGALISTAMTPIIVTLVKEWLRRPAERISAVSAKAPDLAARVVAPARGSARPQARTSRTRVAEAPSVPTPRGEGVVLPAAGGPAADTPPAQTFVEPAPGTSSQYRLYRRRAPHWRIAVVTGLVAFAVAALAITIPELVLGGAVAGNGNTTVFGGGSHGASQGSSEGQKKADGTRSSDGRAAPARQHQTSTPQPAGKTTQPSTGSSQSPSRPSTQQSPSGSPSQSAPSTPSPSTSGQASPGSGPGSPPSSGP
ncbi:MAG: hypothetical protein M3Z33_03875 [Actinomycetota bacterium]|nr:hypothetical protein [Actinomycetota bacterium]